MNEPVPFEPHQQQQNSNEVPDEQMNEPVPAETYSDIPSIPVWSAYNSLISSPTHVTKVGAPPLIAAPAHEWPTLLTILMQAQNITTRVVGTDRKTAISLDMGLNQPAKKPQMARQDLHHLIL